MAIYDPNEWHDFFLAVAGGSAALTGLLVVAMSLHLRIILSDPALSHRARMILAGLAGAFMRCTLVLMGGQGAKAVAIELFAVCLLVVILAGFSYAPISRLNAPHRSFLIRAIGSNFCYGAEMLGAVLLFVGHPWGLNLAAVAMITNFFFVFSGSWLLLLGVRTDETLSPGGGGDADED
ncbi:hypothetical protein AKJ08_0673 [Vulgatibacter incomptus]|uniref:Transmembrane protein n=2 Tax=Vulgatibacter incomptus TaxID=1391653 RepID=A0A0K1PA49_9BACT|nr:hypothetical protein AKJ08_0673 [Vulgatibacter incomptus]